MKKRVSYNFKLRLDGQTAEILNSHCECPAGKGPQGTCKHLAAVLLMISHFVGTGEMLIQESCTEQEQTFHRPKRKYDGSPVKSKDLPRTHKQWTCTTDDPRPQKYRKEPGYNDYVRNLTINFCSNRSEDLTIRFLYEKADLQQAMKDHNYLALPFPEYWVMDALKISKQSADDLERTTRNQAASSVWHEARRWRLTASKFGDIVKATDRRNKTKLCHSIVFPRPLRTKGVIHGRQYEGKAIQLLEKKCAVSVQKAGFFVSEEYPHLGASPDGLIGEDSIVEVKCPYSSRNLDIEPGRSFPFLGVNNEGEVILKEDSRHFVQIQGQLLITRRQQCYFVVYTFKDVFVQKVQFDRQFCEGSILPKLNLFYEKHFRPFIAGTL